MICKSLIINDWIFCLGFVVPACFPAKLDLLLLFRILRQKRIAALMIIREKKTR